MAQKTPLPAKLLREHTEKDAPLREGTVARFMSGICAVSGVLALALIPMIGVTLGAGLGVLLLTLAGYYFAMMRLIGRGWFRPWVAWLNVAIEVSAPSLIFVLDWKQHGSEYALTAPPLIIWGTLIALSGLRGSRQLALAAGALAAVEYSLLYAFLALPTMPADAPVTLMPALFIPRVVLLFGSSVFTAAFVGILNRRAEEALAAVRAKDVFGKYLLHERLGAGGMAEVFRATYNPEGGFEKTVALKRVLPQFAADEKFIAMFRDEAALCSQFSHPSVVQVFDFGRFGDTYFLAMEFLDGAPLNRLLRRYHGRGLPIGAVVHLAVSLCEALHYLHERRSPDGTRLNLIHRDLNPPNILVSRLGEVKLTDFGIARAASQVELTQIGQVKGKPGYLAPEQAAGEAIDGRVDLFALGVTLWECTVGLPLLTGGTVDDVIRASFDKPINSPLSRRADVPPELDAVIMGLLERDLPNRTPSAWLALKQLRGLEAKFATGAQELARAVDDTLKNVQPSAVALEKVDLREAATVVATPPPSRRHT